MAGLVILVRRFIYKLLYTFDQVVRTNKKFVIVLCYHSIAADKWRFSIDPEVFTAQMSYLKSRYDVWTMQDLTAYLEAKKTLKRQSVVITVDDGYNDILEVKPFLDKKHIVPTLFALADPKHANVDEMKTKRPFLRITDLKRLEKDGWTIGSHTNTHANLATLSKKKVASEVIGSKKSLEKSLHHTITMIAYPRGKYSPIVLNEVGKASYHYGFTMDDGIISPKTDPLRIPRVGVDRTHSLAEFKTIFSPSVIMFRKAVKKTIIGRYL